MRTLLRFLPRLPRVVLWKLVLVEVSHISHIRDNELAIVFVIQLV